MSILKQNQLSEIDKTESQWKNVYMLGGISAIIVILGTLLDIIIGTVAGGDLSAIPKNAVDRFAQFQANSLLGLYHLDLLNITTSIILIPTFFALFAAHRRENIPYSMLALIIFLVGTAIFVSNNTALPMLELSNKYATSTTEAEKTLLAAAGEAMLARGVHGSPGVFIGFVLSLFADILISFVMLTGKIFNKVTGFLGLLGNGLLLVYIVLVTFIPQVKTMAMIFATPGGLLALAWMTMFTIRLFKLAHLKNS